MMPVIRICRRRLVIAFLVILLILSLGNAASVYGILYSIEETLEMTAVMIANWAFMTYAMEHCRGLNLQLKVEP